MPENHDPDGKPLKISEEEFTRRFHGEQPDVSHVRPQDITCPRGESSFDFGSAESDLAAYLIVCLCQAKKDWQPFTRLEFEIVIMKHEAGSHHALAGLSQLAQSQHLAFDQATSTYRTTDAFVCVCHQGAGPEISAKLLPNL